MEKLYKKIGWKNKPNLSTPLGATNLKKIDEALDGLDNRTIELDTQRVNHKRLIDGLYVETDALKKEIEEVSDLEKKVDDLTGFSNVMATEFTRLDGRVTEAENRITKNTEDIDALKIVPTASGSPVYIKDASNMNIENIIFYGESKQMQTTGKNLLQNTAVTRTDAGLTYTVNSDGSVTVNGTATGLSIVKVGNFKNTDRDLILSGCPSGGNTNTYKLSYYHETTQVNDFGSGVTLPKNDLTYEVRIVIYGGTTINNLTFKPMIRLATITDATYEPYTGGKASPSPDYPQPIESKTVNRVDVYGKNLLKFSQGSTTSNGITFTVNADKSVTVNGTATADAVLLLTTSTRGEVDLKRLTGKNIILSGCPNGGSSSTYKFQFWSASKWAVDTGNGATLDLSTVPDTWNFAISIISGTTLNNLTFKPMIRLASITDATYEPYQSQTKSLASGTYRLDGIGDLKNYYDAKRGVYGGKVDRVTFDGSDDEAWSFGTTNNGRRMQINIPVKPVSNVNVKGNVLCDRYIVTTAGENYMEKQGIAVDTSSRLYVYDANFKSSLISDWKTYLQANPMTVVYELAEPEEGKLISSVKDEFAEFLKLHTYKPNTIVDAQDTLIHVQYVADTKAYIDQKFETLASAIVNQ